MLGLYVLAGMTVFTPTNLDASIIIKVDLREGAQYKVTINADSKVYFRGEQLMTAKMSDNNVIHTLINNIIKQGFRDTKLKQISR